MDGPGGWEAPLVLHTKIAKKGGQNPMIDVLMRQPLVLFATWG